MALPGFRWLGEHLRELNEVEGGLMRTVWNPVTGGAVWAMMGLLVLAWVIALPALLLWAGVRRVMRGGG